MAVASPPESSPTFFGPSLHAYLLVQQGLAGNRLQTIVPHSQLSHRNSEASKSVRASPIKNAPEKKAHSKVCRNRANECTGPGVLRACITSGGGVHLGSTCLWPKLKTEPEPSRIVAPAKKGCKRILIMMSNTGGGHKASAEGIKAAIEELYGKQYEIIIVDMWQQHTPPPFNQLPDSYSFLVRHANLWRFTYTLTNPKLIHIPYLTVVGMCVAESILSAVKQYDPDLVVSVHPLMQHVPIKALTREIRAGTMRPINFATVVTDFTTCHNTWFHRGVTRCFVPTEYCRNLARRQGLDEKQIVLHGLPIRPAFSKKLPAKATLRKNLGLDAALPAILVVGGGEGMGPLEELVSQLDARLGDRVQVAVICGRNKALLDKLGAKPQGVPHMKILAKGFVDNLHEWMPACDLIITKAGPGTIAEALIAGLPIILNGNVPCQEEGNIPYVVDNQVGCFERRPRQISEIVERWLEPGSSQLADMSRRSKALGRPEAVYQIARDLVVLTNQPDFEFGPAVAAPAAAQAALVSA